MNPTKQQLEDELLEVEISVDFYIKKIEQAEKRTKKHPSVLRK